MEMVTKFFTKGENVGLILWKWHQDGTIDSVLFITDVNKNWNQIAIPGRAFFLGEKADNKICSIKIVENNLGFNWKISFYDISGLKTYEIDHQPESQDRQLSQDDPVPIVCEDGSVFFYVGYMYSKHNMFLYNLENLISGGHGAIKWGYYIEVVPSLIKGSSARNKKLSYTLEKCSNFYGTRVRSYVEKTSDMSDVVNKKRIKDYDVFEHVENVICVDDMAMDFRIEELTWHDCTYKAEWYFMNKVFLISKCH